MQLDKLINKELEEVNCPTCGDSPRSLLHKYSNICFYRCNTCDLEYASPRLKEKDLIDLYQGDYWRSYSDFINWNYEEWLSNKDKTFHLANQNLKLVRKFLDYDSNILDVGCDIGLTVKILNENRFNCEGIEVSEISTKIANEIVGAEVKNTSLESYQSKIKYHGILLRAVLEHLYNPINVLEDCAKNLKKGGLIFIDVPHSRGISTKYKKFLHKIKIKKDYRHFGFPAHLYSFNKKSLTFMLDKSGFDVIYFESWPRALTTGKVSFLNYHLVKLQRKYCLTDYINVVARKR